MRDFFKSYKLNKIFCLLLQNNDYSNRRFCALIFKQINSTHLFISVCKKEISNEISFVSESWLRNIWESVTFHIVNLICAHRTIKCFKKLQNKIDFKMFVSRSIGLYILLNFNVLCQEQRLSLKVAYPEDEEEHPHKPNAQVKCRKVLYKYSGIIRFG